MKHSNIVVSFAVGSALLAVPCAMTQAELKADEKGFVRLQLGEEQWEEYPGIPGIDRMTVYGDPSKPGVYVIRVRFQPGVMSMPHFHPEDRLATVLKGTWWTGTGEDFEPEATEPIRAGGWMLHPAGAAHFDGAKDEEVVLQLAGVGPSGTTFIRPELGRTGRSR
ncbi:MAG TPA: cupin domain-containing protein [Burkholderiales bacterium]|jgi:quercetin dioxygenase-like cupin family protein|nr:cupin domain-containing protein [Burkholderiales bacterium]